MTTTTISFEADEELKEKIREQSEAEYRSQSSYLRKILNQHLNPDESSQSDLNE